MKFSGYVSDISLTWPTRLDGRPYRMVLKITTELTEEQHAWLKEHFGHCVEWEVME